MIQRAIALVLIGLGTFCAYLALRVVYAFVVMGIQPTDNMVAVAFVLGVATVLLFAIAYNTE